AVGSALVLYVGALHVKQGVLTLGSLLVVTAYLAQLYEPLRTISTKIADLQAGYAGAERCFALLDTVPEVDEQPHARKLKRARGDIEFRDVAFSYYPGQPVLEHVSLVARAGSRVGLQGRTGAGKTTLIGLLMRFHDPDSGGVLLDGVDIREY